MITHTVAFKLTDPDETDTFLQQAAKLAHIPGVEEFVILRQVGKKNAFTHALSMQFATQAAYDAYDSDDRHQDFVARIWMPKVSDFIELDYVATKLSQRSSCSQL